MKRILIADDEYFVRMGIKSTIEWKESEFIVETEAENGNEAEAMILENEPDIVFLDITMPGQSGLEVLEKVRKRGYGGYIVMLTCHEDFRMVQQAMRIGADDYVLKNDLTGERCWTICGAYQRNVWREAERERCWWRRRTRRGSISRIS